MICKIYLPFRYCDIVRPPRASWLYWPRSAVCLLRWVGRATETFTAFSSASIQSRISEALSVTVFSGWCHIQQLASPSPVRGDWLVCFGLGEAYLSRMWEQGGQVLLMKYLAEQESFDGYECSVRPPASIYTLYPNQFGQNWTWVLQPHFVLSCALFISLLAPWSLL